MCIHLGVISFWLIGFGIAFGEGSPYIGLTNFAGYGLSFRNYAMLFFQVSYEKIPTIHECFSVFST